MNKKHKKSATKASARSEPPRRTRTRGTQVGALAGSQAGALLGASAGPPGAIAGLVLGAAAGALAGRIIDREATRAAAREQELDAAIGVTSGNLGAFPLPHGPTLVGFESAEDAEDDAVEVRIVKDDK